METIRLIKTMHSDYININHIIQLCVEDVIKGNKHMGDWRVAASTVSPGDFNARVALTCEIGDKDMAMEICCAIASFMHWEDEMTLFCVQTYVEKTWPEESHLKLVVDKEGENYDN